MLDLEGLRRSLPSNARLVERLAIKEFNDTHELRKIELDRFLRYRRVYKNSNWLERLYQLHVLDHPARQPGTVPPRATLVL
jgi:hypothetical protein